MARKTSVTRKRPTSSKPPIGGLNNNKRSMSSLDKDRTGETS